jgi:hypothetical protein
MHLAVSGDGRTLLTACSDRTARLWRMSDGRPLDEPLRHQGTVVHAAFSPDGKRVVTASRDKTARVWDATTGQPLSPPFRHAGEPCMVAFLPDSRAVLTMALMRDHGTQESLILGKQGRVRVNWEMSVRRWTVPGRLEVAVEQVERWAEGVTGMELDPGGVAGLLEAEAWQERRRQVR